MFIIFIVMKNIISETNRMKKLMNLPINESDGELEVFPVTGMFDIGWDQELQDKLNKGTGLSNPKHRSDFSTKRTDERHPNHIGVDIFGEKGSKVVSPVNGKVRTSDGKISGKVVTVEDKDGYCHFMGHLNSITVEDGQIVFAGEEVGTLGDTGNAKGTAPHVHYNVYKCSSGFNSGTDPFNKLMKVIDKRADDAKKPDEETIAGIIGLGGFKSLKDKLEDYFSDDDNKDKEDNKEKEEKDIKDLESEKDDKNKGIIDYLVKKGESFIKNVIDSF